MLLVTSALNTVEESMMELKRDPVEDTEEYKAVAEEVESMAESLVDPNIRYGRYFLLKKKRRDC